MVVNGITYVGAGIQAITNTIIDAGTWVGGKIVEGATWIGNQTSAAWNSIASYFEKPVCQEDIITGIGNITRRHDDYECIETADEVVAFLKKNNQHGSIITIKYPSYPGYVFSVMYNKLVSTNGRHRGVCYKGTVYCNVHPFGLPKQTWINDFVADGKREVFEIQF